MKIEAFYEAILDTLGDVVPEGGYSIEDGVGESFGDASRLVSDADLAADLGPGTLEYRGIESTEPVGWDVDSLRVIQRNGRLVLTGVVSEIQ